MKMRGRGRYITCNVNMGENKEVKIHRRGARGNRNKILARNEKELERNMMNAFINVVLALV